MRIKVRSPLKPCIRSLLEPVPEIEDLASTGNAEHNGNDRPSHAQPHIEGRPPPVPVLNEGHCFIAEGREGGVSATEAGGEQAPKLGCDRGSLQRVVDQETEEE